MMILKINLIFKEMASMPIARIKVVKCKNCKKRFVSMIGDVRPQKLECKYCHNVWFYNK